MKLFTPFALLALLMLGGCSSSEQFQSPYASGYHTSEIESCVPYARRISGISLYGNADSWWHNAKGRYARGNQPRPGAILVLKKTSRMRSGHVAVVKDVLGPRQINVTHSNWGDTASSRRMIYESMRVEDISAANNWSQVRFWNHGSNVFGFPYASYGFIYP